MKAKDLPPHLREQAAKQILEQQSRFRGRAKELVYPYVFALKTELTSLNKYTGETGHYLRAERKREFHWHLRSEKLSNVKTPRFFQEVTIIRFYKHGDREFDDGNLAGGDAKQLVDAMTECGFWYDDSPKYISIEFREQPIPPKSTLGFTMIQINLTEQAVEFPTSSDSAQSSA